MLKSIKKLFSIDESEVDLDEIDLEIDDKKELYKKQIKQTENKVPVFPKTNTKEFEDESAKYTEVKAPEPEVIIEPVALDEIKEIQDNTKPLVDENEVSKKTRRSFDFEQVIEKSYEPRTNEEKSFEEKNVKVEKEQPVVKEKQPSAKYTRDNYVLKDLISPMKGIVRKEKPMPKKGSDHKKANIIKLREEVKTKELDVKDNYKEILDFSLEATDTKDLESSLNKLSKAEVKDTLSETSRFTLIEDSTGEMRLVIDEED